MKKFPKILISLFHQPFKTSISNKQNIMFPS